MGRGCTKEVTGSFAIWYLRGKLRTLTTGRKPWIVRVGIKLDSYITAPDLPYPLNLYWLYPEGFIEALLVIADVPNVPFYLLHLLKSKLCLMSAFFLSSEPGTTLSFPSLGRLRQLCSRFRSKTFKQPSQRYQHSAALSLPRHRGQQVSSQACSLPGSQQAAAVTSQFYRYFPWLTFEMIAITLALLINFLSEV